jgi:3-ketosteroid 9alpha-monooxygenase subunit B
MTRDPLALTVADSSQVPLEPGVPFHALRVAEVIRETPDACSLVLEIPPDLEPSFAYQPGQFVTLRIPWQGFQIARCYSLASCALAGEAPKITVKRVPGGRMSNWLNDHLAAGDRIEVRPPAGAFVLRPEDAPLVMFGAGSGITPLISLIKSALLSTSRQVRLLYANRDERSIIFRAELDALARRHPGCLSIAYHLDDRSGLLRAPQLERAIRGWEGASFYLCGPTPFMEAAQEALEARGVPRERVHVERFVSAVDPDRRGEAPAAVEATAPAALPSRFRLTLDHQTHEVPYLEGKTLLQSARAAGFDPPFSCEEGYCSCCMARLREGRVAMAINDALSAKDVAAGLVLTCQARPLTPEIWIDYDV